MESSDNLSFPTPISEAWSLLFGNCSGWNQQPCAHPRGKVYPEVNAFGALTWLRWDFRAIRHLSNLPYHSHSTTCPRLLQAGPTKNPYKANSKLIQVNSKCD